MAGITVKDIILEQLASAEAVLSADEQELGVAVLDIGGGTSDLALYQQGNIRHTMVLPVAGNHFTHDLAIGLATSIEAAERIKKEYGLACADVLVADDVVEVPSLNGSYTKIVQLTDILRIINPRAQEIFAIVHDEIISKRLQGFMPTGLVLTGGGSLLKGMQELAYSVFHAPVRIGHVRCDLGIMSSLNSPIYATGYGLIMYALKRQLNSHLDHVNGPLVKRVFERMKSWVMDFF
jgi:cell division protein FtsA